MVMAPVSLSAVVRRAWKVLLPEANDSRRWRRLSVAFRVTHQDSPSAASRRLSQLCSSRWRARIARALSRIDSP